MVLGILGASGSHHAIFAQVQAVGMPAGWENLEAGEFAAAAQAYLSQRPIPTGELAQQVVQHAWDQFLANEGEAAAPVSLPTLSALAVTTRPHASWLRNVDGSPMTVAAVEARLQEVMASVREQFQRDSGVVEGFDFPQLWRSWYGIVPPGEPPGAERFVIPRDFAEQRAAAFATWMETHDWPSLLLGYRMWLEEGLVFDEVSTEAFSVRWTGQVTAPADGAYRFGQLSHSLADGTCRIFLADQLVFETEALSVDAPAEPAQLGDAVTLQAGQPASLRVEYVYDRSSLADRLIGSSLLQVDSSQLDRLYPMMVLMWEGPGGLQIVPPDALSPPAPNPENAEAGMLCESFSGLDLATPAATAITPGVGSVWTVAPVVPRYAGQLAEVHADCLGALMENPRDAPMVYDLFVFARFAGMMDIWQRQRLHGLLVAQPDLLGHMEANRFARLFEELAMLRCWKSGTTRPPTPNANSPGVSGTSTTWCSAPATPTPTGRSTRRCMPCRTPTGISRPWPTPAARSSNASATTPTAEARSSTPTSPWTVTACRTTSGSAASPAANTTPKPAYTTSGPGATTTDWDASSDAIH